MMKTTRYLVRRANDKSLSGLAGFILSNVSIVFFKGCGGWLTIHIEIIELFILME